MDTWPVAHMYVRAFTVAVCKTLPSSKSPPLSCGLKKKKSIQCTGEPASRVEPWPLGHLAAVEYESRICVSVWAPRCRQRRLVSYVGGRSRDRYRGQGTNDGRQFICALCVRTYRQKVWGGSSASASLAVREAACGNAWLRSPDRDTPLKIWSAPRCPLRSADRTGGWREDAPPLTALTNADKRDIKGGKGTESHYLFQVAVSECCLNNLKEI